MRFEHEPADDDLASIRIEGLEQDLTILHVTDSHMAEGDDRDPDAADAVTRLQKMFQERTPGGVPAWDLFRRALAMGAGRAVDAVQPIRGSHAHTVLSVAAVAAVTIE